MSLIQRVTPLEGFDREVLDGDDDEHVPLSRTSSLTTSHHNNNSSTTAAAAVHLSLPRGVAANRHLHPGWNGTVRSLRHVISYDALPRPSEESRATHPTGGVTAYKVSTLRRVAQVIVTTLACWLSSGIVFGFAALKPVLIDQGVYRALCSREELEAGVDVCYEQDLRLNLFFAIASTTCNVSALPVGTLLDRYGPRVATALGSVFLAIGSVLMAQSFAITEFDGYIAGNIFLALGGTFIFVPSFQIANAFPKYSGAIVALVTGAFDASAAVFLFYRMAYQASNGGFTPDQFFYGYLVVPALILLAQFTIMNSDGYKTVPQLEEKIEKHQDVTHDVHDSDDDLADRDVRRLREQRRDHRESVLAELDKLLGDAEERQAKVEKIEEVQFTSGVWGVLHGKSAHEQMLSPWFILITCLTVLQMLRMNFFIASVKAQYEYMLGSATIARQINNFFDAALPIGGVVATPFIGILLDRVSTATLLAILVTLITIVGVLGSLPFVWTGYGNVILFVLLRPLYYSAMSDYAAKVFGFATFGRVYGAIICFSGLVNLTQPIIDAVNHGFFQDNPIPINATLAALGFVFGVFLVIYVWIEGKRERRIQHQPRQMTERDRLIPEMVAEEEEEEDYGSIY